VLLVETEKKMVQLDHGGSPVENKLITIKKKSISSHYSNGKKKGGTMWVLKS